MIVLSIWTVTHQDEGGIFSVECVALINLSHGGVHPIGGRRIDLVGNVDAEEGVVLGKRNVSRQHFDPGRGAGRRERKKLDGAHQVVVHEVHSAVCAGA